MVFFELIYHDQNNETEIAYFGILEEYQNKKLALIYYLKLLKNLSKKMLAAFGFIHVH